VIVLAGPPPAWWGWTVLSLGVLSGVLGVLWALAQHDMKRLLAYHSVENIGIIFMGLGLGALGTAYQLPVLAILGYGGAILHTVNHALFKALLFVSMGAVYRMTGTRNLEELGGLARRMPITCAAFLIGSIAIIGVPPLNGFVSEWLVYQGSFARAWRQVPCDSPSLVLRRLRSSAAGAGMLRQGAGVCSWPSKKRSSTRRSRSESRLRGSPTRLGVGVCWHWRAACVRRAAIPSRCGDNCRSTIGFKWG